MANNIDVKNAAGTTQTMQTTENGSVHIPAHSLHKTDGTALLAESTSANSVPVVLPSDMPLMGRGLVNAQDSFTRPSDTTAYAAGDLVANSTTAGSVVALSFTVARYTAGGAAILRARLGKSTTTLAGAVFRLHLYTSTPGTISNGDNGAFSTSGVTTTPSYIGWIDIVCTQTFTNGAIGFGVPDVPIFVKLASGTTIKGLLEVKAAYTPGNGETFAVMLEAEQI